MASIQKYRFVGRVMLLVLLGISFVGPWFFDVIMVPAEYECNLPFVRLDDELCGRPISFLQYFWMIIGSSVSTTRALVSGSLTLYDWSREYLFGFMFYLAVLPIFSILFLLWKPKHRSLRIFNWITWSMAAVIALASAILLSDMRHPALWGIWLYRAVVVLALLWEGVLSKGQHSDVLVENSGALP